MDIQTPDGFSDIESLLEFWKNVRKGFSDKLHRISPEDFTCVPEKGWSFSQLAEHLYLSQIAVAFIITKSRLSEIKPEKPDYQKILYDYLNKKGMPNPEAVGPKNNYPKEKILSLLGKAEHKMQEAARKAGKTELQSRGWNHPYAGDISVFDFIWLMAVHEYSHYENLLKRLEK